jgi:ribosomal protein S18 acetylase RimI-like enzyme
MMIRAALPEDYEALLPLFLGLRRYSRERHPPLSDDFDAVLAASREYLREVLGRAEDAVTLLAVADDGALAGYLVGVVHAPNLLTSAGAVRTGAIDELYVAEGYRGGGAGGALVRAGEAWFREHGAERLEVGAYAWNREGIAFYERHGFAVWGVTLARPLVPSAGSPIGREPQADG